MSESEKQALIQSIRERLNRIEAELAEYRQPAVYQATLHMNKRSRRSSQRSSHVQAA